MKMYFPQDRIFGHKQDMKHIEAFFSCPVVVKQQRMAKGHRGRQWQQPYWIRVCICGGHIGLVCAFVVDILDKDVHLWWTYQTGMCMRSQRWVRMAKGHTTS